MPSVMCMAVCEAQRRQECDSNWTRVRPCPSMESPRAPILLGLQPSLQRATKQNKLYTALAIVTTHRPVWPIPREWRGGERREEERSGVEWSGFEALPKKGQFMGEALVMGATLEPAQTHRKYLGLFHWRDNRLQRAFIALLFIRYDFT